MIRFIFFLLFVNIIFSCSLNNKSHLKLSCYDLRFDTVNAKATKSKIMTLYNIGKSDLIVYNFQCSCECSVLDLPQNSIIKPKDSINFNLIIKGYDDDKNKWKTVECTFKTNSDSVYSYLNISYFTK